MIWINNINGILKLKISEQNVYNLIRVNQSPVITLLHSHWFQIKALKVKTKWKLTWSFTFRFWQFLLSWLLSTPPDVTDVNLIGHLHRNIWMQALASSLSTTPMPLIAKKLQSKSLKTTLLSHKKQLSNGKLLNES